MPPRLVLRPELRAVLDDLVVASEDSRFVGLDVLAERLGTLAVSHEEIDALVDALEAKGRRVDTGASRPASASLATVVATARRLKASLGRVPTPGEIAASSGLPLTDVRHALAFVRVLARGK